LPAEIQASAAIAFKKDLRRDAGVKNFVHVFLVDPWCAEPVHRSLQDDEVGRGMFAYFFIGFVAALDHGLGNGVTTLHEERLREFHEGQVQLALRPAGIGEMGVNNECFHLVTDEFGEGPRERRRMCRASPR
jgi:hypothetical protein